MEAEKFVKSLREVVINENLIEYEKILSSDLSEVTDLTWQPIVAKYQSFTETEKESFLNFIRLIEVNTLSNVLGIIDGSSYLDENGEEFELRCTSDDEVISGDLQDYFLGMEEDDK